MNTRLQITNPESSSTITTESPNHLPNISNMTVDEILIRYQDNTQLLFDALTAKADEDKVILFNSLIAVCVY
jgi:hypothetical protein